MNNEPCRNTDLCWTWIAAQSKVLVLRPRSIPAFSLASGIQKSASSSSSCTGPWLLRDQHGKETSLIQNSERKRRPSSGDWMQLMPTQTSLYATRPFFQLSNIQAVLRRSSSQRTSSTSKSTRRWRQEEVNLMCFFDLLQARSWRICHESIQRPKVVDVLTCKPLGLSSGMLRVTPFDCREIICLRIWPNIRILRSRVNTKMMVHNRSKPCFRQMQFRNGGIKFEMFWESSWWKWSWWRSAIFPTVCRSGFCFAIGCWFRSSSAWSITEDLIWRLRNWFLRS